MGDAGHDGSSGATSLMTSRGSGDANGHIRGASGIFPVKERQTVPAERPQRMSIAFLAPAHQNVDGEDRARDSRRDSRSFSGRCVPTLSSIETTTYQGHGHERFDPYPGPSLAKLGLELDVARPNSDGEFHTSNSGRRTSHFSPKPTASDTWNSHHAASLPHHPHCTPPQLLTWPTNSTLGDADVERRGSRSNSGSESGGTLTPTTTRTSRAPRPAYTEEQKFFIMYMRIILQRPWSAIEDAYTDMFGPDRVGGRSKGGLTSVYYRIRRNWGLEEVLQTSPDCLASDRRMIEQRACNFSEDFLASIGYPVRD